ncbi:MAG: trigger factor [Myxococcota bacterium]
MTLVVTVEEEGAVTRTLQVEVPRERVDASFAQAYRDLARRARVRGFRPGKAPRGVLEKLYGASLAEELERTLVDESLEEALRQCSLEPVSRPTVDAKPPAAGAPFVYRARVEVKPEFTLPELTGLPARRPRVEVGVGDVETELEQLRQRRADLVEESEDTPAEEGHLLSMDFEGRVDGELLEGGAGENVDVELGSGRFLPGFEAGLVGVHSGEARELRCRLPEDDGGPHAGKEVVFQIQVHSVRRRDLPELDDEFAKDLGDFETLGDLRARIQRDLESTRTQEAERVLRRTLLDALIERTPFELPPGMRDLALDRRLARAHRELEGQVPQEALHEQLGRWRQEWRPSVEHEVREELILDAIVRAREIEVAEEDLEARLDRLAGGKADERRKLREAYEKGGLLDALRGSLAREQALDFLVSEAKVEETTDT